MRLARLSLWHPLLAAGKNEFGRLTSVIAAMRNALVDSISRVRSATAQIDIGSRKLAIDNQNLSSRTDSTAASLEQIAASIEQITVTV